MRKRIRLIIKECFRNELLKVRETKTQEEMAISLHMSVRAYCNLENGKSCCSLITLILFLIHCCPDRERFLKDLFDILDHIEENVI